ncbi:DUF3572 domain-containing protein [Martelella alba]|uniref:DUF3572 domain-containing protein n=1 Tax=Martelella alba TaxID=2590451 RepID=UPI001F3C16C4|nr:DUF3572 domain-containing protein [Martelella alba]
MADFLKASQKTRKHHPAPEELAVEILLYLAAEPELLSRFSALTGIMPQQLRAFSAEPGFSRAMVGFLAGHEPTLIAFCQATGTDPDAVLGCWQDLERQDGGSAE